MNSTIYDEEVCKVLCWSVAVAVSGIISGEKNAPRPCWLTLELQVTRIPKSIRSIELELDGKYEERGNE
jgi:hypothetical protein